jgi:hypothetical protein
MKSKLFAALVGWLAAGGMLCAQTAPAAPASASPAPGTPAPSAAPIHAPEGAVVQDDGQPSDWLGGGWGHPEPECGHRVWFSSEALAFWIKNDKVTQPLIGSTLVPEDLGSSIRAGSLADPNLVVLYGGNDLDYHTFAGIRNTLGAALNADGSVSWEISQFLLERRSTFFGVQSNANGVPAITLLFNQVFPQPTGETSAVFAGVINGTALTGRAAATSHSQLWGAESNLVCRMCDTGSCWKFGLLGGVRYLDLNEDLSLFAEATSGAGGTISDSFRTHNQFGGGQGGVRAAWCGGPFEVQATGKVALGVTVETLNIGGATIPPTNINGGVPVVGGFYAVSSNSGQFQRARFAVLPEASLTLAYHVSSWLSVTAGYSFLYLSETTRPGDQIDHRLNANLNPGFGGGPNGVGPRFPQPVFGDVDFYAHGVSLGVELSF